MLGKRTNGYTWPPDKAQLFSIFFVFYFAIMFPGTFIMSLTTTWIYVIGFLFLMMYVCMLVLLLVIMYIDPSEFASVNKKKITPATFDREKHKHVIENQFCNICKMVVSFKAKHCRKCNKCVTDFDHHCVYLNNCIGSKNYKLFIALITHACIGSFFMFLIGLIEFSLSFVNNQYFLTKRYFSTNNITICNDTNCDDKYKFLPVMFIVAPINVWRPFAALTTFLSFVAFVLIAYLLGYHFYLKLNKMSTYEHSLMLRDQEKDKNLKPTDESIKKTTIKSIELPRSPLPPVKSQPVMSIDERITTTKLTNSAVNKGYLSNENNYLEVSYRKQNKLNSLKRQPHIDLNDNDLLNNLDFPLEKSNLNSNSVARIPCINSDAKNKYAKLENSNHESDMFTSESANSTFSQRQVPIFLPTSSNLSGNEEKEEEEVYVKRSSRRSKLVKVPLNYYDTSPETPSRVVKESSHSKYDHDIRRTASHTADPYKSKNRKKNAHNSSYSSNQSDSDDSMKIKSMKFERQKSSNILKSDS